MPGTPLKKRPISHAEKVSVSVDQASLKRAKIVAKRNGMSLSRFFTEAVDLLVNEEERREAARALVATFPAEALPTDEEMETFRREWSTPRTLPPKKRRAAK